MKFLVIFETKLFYLANLRPISTELNRSFMCYWNRTPFNEVKSLFFILFGEPELLPSSIKTTIGLFKAAASIKKMIKKNKRIFIK